MRGFSNKAFAAAPPREVLDFNPVLDIAKRFAPEHPYAVVVSNKQPAPRVAGDEMAMLLDLASKSFKQGFRCLWAIHRVLLNRAKLRIKIAYHRVVQSRYCAWTLAGCGWGVSLGLSALVSMS